MKCSACESTDQQVLSTRQSAAKVTRLRRCCACGHKWTTVEMAADNLTLLEKAAKALKQFATLAKEIEDAAPSHG
ncbi:hypothetical protein [Variovorax sp. 278MFTsu5.1]|jgi:transcriptional regulator NrdR family protein|uniref:NrdR family transcriptional regulator n=1 Tax=Variovorax sp. 278MFTsu5.1 TaxID=3158366 RepID=UPI003AAAAB77